MEVEEIQKALREKGVDGWLFCDFHNRDHLAYRILGLDFHKMTSRRWYYYIPVDGEPTRLVHSVEKTKLDSLPGRKMVYLPWEQLHSSLEEILGGPKKIAMQYSPLNNIPYTSIVDGGTIELIKSFGHEIVSSGDLVQQFEAIIDEKGYESHIKAGDIIQHVKLKEPGSIYYDITWCGFIGDEPPERYQEIFHVVRDARIAAVNFVRKRFAEGKPCYGWEVDDACRNVVVEAGYGDYFIHRTGHSIGEEVHGNGVHIDNLETKDERLLVPGICFSIEPGIYLEGEMAARSEIDCFITLDGKVVVHGEEQMELVRVHV
jgi:hypothetical protein